MSLQSEAALENGLIATLQKMNYEYVHIEEEKNLYANFKLQLEKHNHKRLGEFGRTQFTDGEFDKILIYLEGGLKRIEDSTLGHDSEEDFGGLFSDIDLASPKLGKTADDKNTLVSNVLLALDDIDFGVEASQEIDILGDAYEYMISQFAAGAGKKAGEFYTPQEVSRILAAGGCRQRLQPQHSSLRRYFRRRRAYRHPRRDEGNQGAGSQTCRP